jgi:hypothetical protein
MSEFIAILWTATELTPPAPMTSTLLICASPEVLKGLGDIAARIKGGAHSTMMTGSLMGGDL